MKSSYSYRIVIIDFLIISQILKKIYTFIKICWICEKNLANAEISSANRNATHHLINDGSTVHCEQLNITAAF